MKIKVGNLEAMIDGINSIILRGINISNVFVLKNNQEVLYDYYKTYLAMREDLLNEYVARDDDNQPILTKDGKSYQMKSGYIEEFNKIVETIIDDEKLIKIDIFTLGLEKLVGNEFSLLNNILVEGGK